MAKNRLKKVLRFVLQKCNSVTKKCNKIEKIYSQKCEFFESVTKKCNIVTFFFSFARPKNPVISTVCGFFVTFLQKNH